MKVNLRRTFSWNFNNNINFLYFHSQNCKMLFCILCMRIWQCGWAQSSRVILNIARPDELRHALQYTVNEERFAGPNIHGFSPMNFFMEILCDALASSVYYFTIAKYSQEKFHSTLKYCKGLAQRIFPLLQYIAYLPFNNSYSRSYTVAAFNCGL